MSNRALFWWLYGRRDSPLFGIRLKHTGLLDFPINEIGISDPSSAVQIMDIALLLSLIFFPPLYVSFPPFSGYKVLGKLWLKVDS